MEAPEEKTDSGTLDSKERFAALGIETLILPNKEFTAMVRSKLAHYGKIVKEVGIASQ